MTATSFDFSQKPELASLAHVARDLHCVAQPLAIDLFLMGAAARDLMLREAWGIDTGRKTRDIDFSVMVNSWETFAALRAGLLGAGSFLPRDELPTHRLRHQQTGLPLDIVPFGAIERSDKKISWPPDQTTVFDCFGMREAFQASVAVLLPESIRLKVANIPALAVLKIAAWHDRHQEFPGKDAGDLLLYLRHYLDCGHLERASALHADLFEAADYDHEQCSATLLGRDIALMLDTKAQTRVLEILRPQAGEQGPLMLASQSGRGTEPARAMLAALCDGMVKPHRF